MQFFFGSFLFVNSFLGVGGLLGRMVVGERLLIWYCGEGREDTDVRSAVPVFLISAAKTTVFCDRHNRPSASGLGSGHGRDSGVASLLRDILCQCVF